MNSASQTVLEEKDEGFVEEITAATISLHRPSTRRRNYWATTNPSDCGNYPRYEPLPYLKEARLIERAQNGDTKARNEIWIRHCRLVLSVANEFYIPKPLLADAIQEGTTGLARAIEKYEVERYNAFSTYAWHWIRQAIQRFLQKEIFNINIPAHLYIPYMTFRQQLRECVTPLEQSFCLSRWQKAEPRQYLNLIRIHNVITALDIDTVTSSAHPTTEMVIPEDEWDLAELPQLMARVLTERQYQIICLRYGLEGNAIQTLAEIGKTLNITRERVRQIQRQAEEMLQNHLQRFRVIVDPYEMLNTTNS